MTTFVLFFCLIFFFAIDVPIAIAIGISSVIALMMKSDLSMMISVQRMYAGTDSFPLMAVPLFMFAGALMEAGGISRRIVNLADSLVGWMTGGLASVAIVSAMFFAGISGSAAADTAAVGSILIPAMIDKGYDRDFAGAVQAAGGSIGVIIPPSIPMIIFGFLTGASIGRLFAAGILPGILMGLSLVVAVVIISKKRGYGYTRKFALRTVLTSLYHALWALGAPIIILGGILGGIFTATESAAVAVIYALGVGLFVHRELHVRDLPRIFIDAAVMSSIIMFIIAAASIFSWFLAIEEIPKLITGFLLSVTTNRIILLLLINAILLVAGTFVETTASLILLVPVILPILPNLGIDLVQLGTIIVVNLAIGMLTPPLGICLLVSCSIAQNKLSDISRSIVPFLAILLIDLLIITFWSPLTSLIPNLVLPTH
ncbi:MAG TPA: TRAP transporter large permease [Deltaproteobacteria bacterium]|nr:TRAP transporter large permease [Deltaproteobacteria bacterium]